MDARSERWREHRKKVRSEIVDAAFRAIDRLGPNVSVREIAEEAGTAKPKIYRHFADKSDMFAEIGQRMRDMLWAAIIPSINVETDPAREIVGRGVEHYVELVDQHPNVGALPASGPVRRSVRGRDDARVNKGSEITLAIADMISTELRGPRTGTCGIRTRGIRDLRYRGVGDRLVAGGRRRQPPPDAAPTEFIAHMTTIMVGAINGTAELLGIKIDAGPADPHRGPPAATVADKPDF